MDPSALQALLDKGVDNALLRFGLGKALLDAGQPQAAAEHLQASVAHDASYSAAWKLLGKAHLAHADPTAARQAWERGIAAAQAKGDKQAEKEMQVFLRKLNRA